MRWLTGRRRTHRGATLNGAVQNTGRFDVSQAVVLASREQLGDLDPGVLRSLGNEFNVETLEDRLCPVLLADHTVALFGVAAHIGGDQADEIVRRMQDRGYRLAPCSRYVLDAPLLLAVARNQLGAVTGSGSRLLPSRSRTALISAFHELIEWGVRQGASDLHLNVLQDQDASEIKYTIKGRYVAPERFRDMPATMLLDMLAVAWMDIQGGNGAVFDPRIEQQGSLVREVDGHDVSIRWASLAADNGPSVCLRILVRDSSVVVDLASLGYLPDQIATLERAMRSEGGAIVFAGTVGSGKSTTLASLISSLPTYRKVITLEDPVEYRIPHAIQNTVSRNLSEGGPDTYVAKLRTLKRSAMSDVLLGEVRDRETGRAFMDLAGAGVKVYTTVHAPSAAFVPQRLASESIGIPMDFLLTPGALRLIVFQTLIARLCPDCCLPAVGQGRRDRSALLADQRDWDRWLDGLHERYGLEPDTLRLRNPAGCDRCRVDGVDALRGYLGRTVAAELIEPMHDEAYLDSVRGGRVDAWLRAHDIGARTEDAGNGHGWRCAMVNALFKAARGEVDPRDIEAHFHAFDVAAKRRRVLPVPAVAGPSLVLRRSS